MLKWSTPINFGLDSYVMVKTFCFVASDHKLMYRIAALPMLSQPDASLANYSSKQNTNRTKNHNILNTQNHSHTISQLAHICVCKNSNAYTLRALCFWVIVWNIKSLSARTSCQYLHFENMHIQFTLYIYIYIKADDGRGFSAKTIRQTIMHKQIWNVYTNATKATPRCLRCKRNH